MLATWSNNSHNTKTRLALEQCPIHKNQPKKETSSKLSRNRSRFDQLDQQKKEKKTTYDHSKGDEGQESEEELRPGHEQSRK